MAILNEFRCEICGMVSQNPVRWLVIRDGDSQLNVSGWHDQLACASDARHLCGEADAHIYISRWLDAMFAGNHVLQRKATGTVVSMKLDSRLCRDRHHGKPDQPSPDHREHGSV